ncbi:MAG: ABC transporter substrate-binding protein [Betaproteobacteria bacterium]|nr:ABC transporter substrate-binding protein [Betaproteobacteria bacterium]MDH4323680.1 ABC transporter substrate-binding protein [Betaproteobacteria bacterium]
MKRMLAAALALVAGAALAEPLAPDALVRDVMLDIQRFIVTDKDLQEGDRAKTIRLIEDKALPHFNHVGMTALAVGVHWRKATPEQKKRLADAFRTLLVRTYASSLSAFGNQKFEFRPLRMKPGDTDVTVEVRVLQSGAQPVPVEYDMEKTARGWQVYDVRVGGISLVVNYRTEFATIVRDKGVDGLIAALEEKNRSMDAPRADAGK